MGYALLIRLTVCNFYEHYAPEMMAVIEGYLRRLLSQRETCYKVSRTTVKEQLLHVSKTWGCTRNTNKVGKIWASVVDGCLHEFIETEREDFKDALAKAFVLIYEEVEGICFECCINTEEGKIRCPGKVCKTRFLSAYIYWEYCKAGIVYGEKQQMASERIMLLHQNMA